MSILIFISIKIVKGCGFLKNQITPVLVIKLYPNSLASKIVCDRLGCLDISEDIFSDTEKKPYAELLNDCIRFSLNKHENKLSIVMTEIQSNKIQIPNEKVISTIEEYSSSANNLFEKHFWVSVKNEYLNILSFFTINNELEGAKREDKFKTFLDAITFPTGNDMINVLSYYDRTPFINLSEEVKEVVSNRISKIDCFSEESINGNIFSSNLAQITMFYINKMKENNIYIHQCAACGDWFAISEVKKSSLCGGTTCRHTPNLSSNERYKEKLKLLPYRDAFDKEYNYWYLRKHRQTLCESDFNKWYNEAKEKLALVESGNLSEESFIFWLMECRKNHKSYKNETLKVGIEKELNRITPSIFYGEESSYWRKCLKSNIISEEKFEEWKKQAQDKLEQTRKSILSSEAFKNWLRICHDELENKGES